MKKVLVSLFVLCVPFIITTQLHAQSLSGQTLQYELDMGRWKYQPLESAKIYVNEGTAISSNKDGRFKIRLPKSSAAPTSDLRAHYADYLHINWKNHLGIRPDSNQLLNIVFMDPEDLYVLNTSFRSLAKHMIAKAYESKISLLGNRLNVSSNPMNASTDGLGQQKLDHQRQVVEEWVLDQVPHWIQLYVGREYKELAEAIDLFAVGDYNGALSLVETQLHDQTSQEHEYKASKQNQQLHAFREWLYIAQLDLEEAMVSRQRILEKANEYDSTSIEWVASLSKMKTYQSLAGGETMITTDILNEATSALSLLEANTPRVLDLYHEYAHHFEKLGALDLAVTHYQVAMEGYEDLLADNHPILGALYHEYAKVKVRQNEKEEAIYFLQKATKIQEQYEQLNKDALAKTYLSYGQLYANLDTRKRSMNYYSKSLNIQKENEWVDTLHLIQLYGIVATSAEQLGQYDEALDQYLLAMSLADQFLKGNHPEKGMTYNNVARILLLKGAPYQGVKYQLKALAVFESVLEKDNPALVVSYKGVAATLDQIGNFEEAIDYYKKALVIEEKVFGIEDKRLASTYYSLSKLYFSLGDQEKSDELMNIALSLGKKTPVRDKYTNLNEKVYDQSFQPSPSFEDSPADQLAQAETDEFTARAAQPDHVIRPLIIDQRYKEAELQSLEQLGYAPDNQEWRLWLTLSFIYHNRMEKARQVWFLFQNVTMENGKSFSENLKSEMEMLEQDGVISESSKAFLKYIQ